MNDNLNIAEQLPENPTTSLIGIITNVETNVQAINDETITTLDNLAGKLYNSSEINAHISDVNEIAQLTDENIAAISSVTAKNAANEESYYSNASNADRHNIAAEDHSVKSNSAAAIYQDAGAKAASLEEISEIKVAVMEVAQKQELGTKEIENRTQAGVAQEMVRAGAIAKEDGEAAQNLEAELKLAAEAPKIG